MVKKLALTSLFNSKNKDISLCPSMYASSNPTPSWPWPSSKHPMDGHHHKAINSAYFLDSADSCFSNSFMSANMSESLSTASEESRDGNEAEAVIHALRSDRLFFEPDTTSSILKVADDSATAAFQGAMAVIVDSDNPYRDFRTSMEEMVMSHGMTKDWRWLEDMLGWFLKANVKNTHGLIVGAFLDLLVELTSPSCPPCINLPSFRGFEVKN